MTDQIWEFTPGMNTWVQKNAVLPVPRGYIPTTPCHRLFRHLHRVAAVSGTVPRFKIPQILSRMIQTLMVHLHPLPAYRDRQAKRRRFGCKCQKRLTSWLSWAGEEPHRIRQMKWIRTNEPINAWQIGPAFVTARRNFAASGDGYHIWLVGGYASDSMTPRFDGNILQWAWHTNGNPHGDGNGNAHRFSTASPTPTATLPPSPTATPTASEAPSVPCSSPCQPVTALSLPHRLIFKLT